MTTVIVIAGIGYDITLTNFEAKPTLEAKAVAILNHIKKQRGQFRWKSGEKAKYEASILKQLQKI